VAVHVWDDGDPRRAVEPLTYFITFATAMGSYVFFALTRSDYEYRGAFDRKYVQYLHRSVCHVSRCAAGIGKEANVVCALHRRSRTVWISSSTTRC
jgi:hypothetical protein